MPPKIDLMAGIAKDLGDVFATKKEEARAARRKARAEKRALKKTDASARGSLTARRPLGKAPSDSEASSSSMDSDDSGNSSDGLFPVGVRKIGDSAVRPRTTVAQRRAKMNSKFIRTAVRVDYDDIISLYKAFKEAVIEVKREACRAPNINTVAAQHQQQQQLSPSYGTPNNANAAAKPQFSYNGGIGSITSPPSPPPPLSVVLGRTPPPSRASNFGEDELPPSQTATGLPPPIEGLDSTSGGVVSGGPTTVVPERPQLPIVLAPTGDNDSGSHNNFMHSLPASMPQGGGAHSPASPTPPTMSPASPHSTPVFFSSGAGSTSSAPSRITLHQALASLKGFLLRDMPLFRGSAPAKGPEEAKVCLGLILSEPMRRIATLLYAERNAKDYERLAASLIRFCEFYMETAHEDLALGPRNPKAGFKFFSSGGGTTVPAYGSGSAGNSPSSSAAGSAATSPSISPLLSPAAEVVFGQSPPAYGMSPPPSAINYANNPDNGMSAAMADAVEAVRRASPPQEDTEEGEGCSTTDNLNSIASPEQPSGRFGHVPNPYVMSSPLDLASPLASPRADGSVLGASALARSINSVCGRNHAPSSSHVSYKKILEILLRSDELPPQKTAMTIIGKCRDILAEETALVNIPAPCVVVGDIHGQLSDLRRIIKECGPFGDTMYLFLGDYVDRGLASIHCMLLLATAKVVYPNRVFLLRGNHESKNINAVYGFLAEIEKKYPKLVNGKPAPVRIMDMFCPSNSSNPMFLRFNDMFRALPLAAIVDNSVFCVHGGLSKFVDSVEAILCVDRFRDIDDGGPIADLTWSDPATGNNFQHNHRGSGCQFGPDVTLDFVRRNNLRFVCRAHQCVKEGYQWSHDNRLVTVFSATDYCGLGNNAAVMRIEPMPNGVTAERNAAAAAALIATTTVTAQGSSVTGGSSSNTNNNTVNTINTATVAGTGSDDAPHLIGFAPVKMMGATAATAAVISVPPSAPTTMAAASPLSSRRRRPKSAFNMSPRFEEEEEPQDAGELTCSEGDIKSALAASDSTTTDAKIDAGAENGGDEDAASSPLGEDEFGRQKTALMEATLSSTRSGARSGAFGDGEDDEEEEEYSEPFDGISFTVIKLEVPDFFSDGSSEDDGGEEDENDADKGETEGTATGAAKAGSPAVPPPNVSDLPDHFTSP